ncbi:MAG: LemA family protein [Prolixibacteraceae bacterium]
MSSFFLFLIISLYNGLINKKNLVAAVQQYTSHEKELLTRITELRSKAVSPNLNPDDKVAIDNQISQAVKGIMVAVENYPDLKANQNFIELQKPLNEVEAQIAASRRTFNAVVTDYNNAVQVFPGNIMAGFMHFRKQKKREPLFRDSLFQE